MNRIDEKILGVLQEELDRANEQIADCDRRLIACQKITAERAIAVALRDNIVTRMSGVQAAVAVTAIEGG